MRSRARLHTNCARVLPYLRSELFLRLDDADLGDELERLLGLLGDMDLIRATADGAPYARGPGGWLPDVKLSLAHGNGGVLSSQATTIWGAPETL